MLLLVLLIFPLRLCAEIDHLSELLIATNLLKDKIERWNEVFLINLEPKLSASAATLASIDSNINNLQERAHAWDTFQLHVSAWNEQLSSLDRKIDIISKAQEKLGQLNDKLDKVLTMEEKLNQVLIKLDQTEPLENRSESLELFNEFTSRGILSSIKQFEKKLDRIVTGSNNNNNVVVKSKLRDERGRLTIKCNTPRVIEDLLNDISSKIDIMFDKSNAGEEYGEEEYLEVEEGSGEDSTIRRVSKRAHQPCKETNRALEELLTRTVRIENATMVILDKEEIEFNKILKTLKGFEPKYDYVTEEPELTTVQDTNTFIPIESTTLESITNDEFSTEPHSNFDQIEKSSCEDLSFEDTTGIYSFKSDSITGTFSTRKKCEIRFDGIWTVIQARDNFTTQNNFNVSWIEYKLGFGDLERDFWIGNEFLHQITRQDPVILRIEMEDFEGNLVWAEYKFQVLSEAENYVALISSYIGNASDSFSSHNGSAFSTYDVKNDEAPNCCPCAVSFGGGWWFTKCFESNLNGIYYRHPNESKSFRGLIWEHWLGNYSLKRTKMMIKAKQQKYYRKYKNRTENIPYYEDP